MKEGPNIALAGSLIGDPARANMLLALMSGKALTASELAREAGITVQTASFHLAKLTDAEFIQPRKQGRHRYFNLAEDVAVILEQLIGLAASRGHTRTRTGPNDLALRKARICYDHLAGESGVQLFDFLKTQGLICGPDEDLQISNSGTDFFNSFEIDLDAMYRSKRPTCKACLDWSARRSHLAGWLGAALLQKFFQLGWARRLDNSRIIQFSPSGEQKFQALLDVPKRN